MMHQKGIHHITVLAGDPRNNVRFYTEVLGMRLVKKSVNQDDPGTYHLFYGNQKATPGSSLTFFPWPKAVQGNPGTGEVVNVALQAPEGSAAFWESRLNEFEVDYSETTVFGRPALRFTDPDGLELDIIFEGEAADAVEGVDYPVTPEYAIQGFWGATMKLRAREETASLLNELFNFEQKETEGNRTLYQTGAGIGHSVIIETGEEEYGKNGRGTVHHIAFRAEDRDELQDLQRKVAMKQLRPTQLIDRHWFKSVYYRIPEGVLFEMASDDPGYTVDEEFEHLGEKLILPPWLEEKRARIEELLPDLN